MLHIRLSGPQRSYEFDHAEGPIEFGRGPQRSLPRQVVDDPFVSRDQLVVEELAESMLRLENLSGHVPIDICDDRPLDLHGERVVKLPVQLRLGKTELHFSVPPTADTLAKWTKTPDRVSVGSTGSPSLRDLGSSPNPETLARWFETVICVQQAAATSTEFYMETARAVVQLVGLDRGIVLLREGDDWVDVAHYTTDLNDSPEFSRGVLNEVLETGRTYYQTLGTAPLRASLENIEAVVTAPIFDKDRRVSGVVYGSRTRGVDSATVNTDAHEVGISDLEAQIIQVLAAAVGAGVERERQQADAIRTQLQFEQFFSSKLARELARDIHLLDGRQREVTISFSDVRDFSRISEHLGPRETFRMMQDVMDLQTTFIHEFDGVVVDYVGDGLLAMWNAPAEQPDHATRACRAVLSIMRELPKLNEKWNPSLPRNLQLGIGINTGSALVGNTGSKVKFKYGPMGSAVNLASRVEDATKQLGSPILITESTYRQLDDSFATRRLCRASLPGIASPVNLYELSTEECTPEWQRRCQVFETALEHFDAKRWADACLAIYPMISDARNEYDVASLHLLSRAVECLKSNPDPFDPVLHLKSK